MRASTDGINVVKVSGSDIAVNTTTYADGDLVGTKITIPEIVTHRKGGILQTIIVHDLDAQDAALMIVFWDRNPKSTTFTNNSVLDIADADLPNVVAKIHVAASDYDDLSDNSIAEVDNLSIPLKGESAGTMYAAIVSNDATPTYSANGLSLCLNLLVDEV